MTQIFISYSRKDIGFVRKLAGDLEKAGYDVWWDLTDLRGGDDWPRVIPAAIESSQFVIVVLSPNSIVSDWVEKEYMQALSLRKKIIPIMLTQSKVPFPLNTINYIDFTGEDYAASLNSLLTTLGYSDHIRILRGNACRAQADIVNVAQQVCLSHHDWHFPSSSAYLQFSFHTTRFSDPNRYADAHYSFVNQHYYCCVHARARHTNCYAKRHRFAECDSNIITHSNTDLDPSPDVHAFAYK